MGWADSPDFRRFVDQFASRDGLLSLQLAFDVTGDPEFPEKAAFEAARELDLPVTTHAGVWGATDNNGIRLMWDHGFMTPRVTYVHSATLSDDSYQRIAASGGYASVATESEQSAGQGYPPTWQLRRHKIPVSLSTDTSVWQSADMFSAMRATLSADRAREHMKGHTAGETVANNSLRASDVVRWATIDGAKALGLDNTIGSITPGKKADLVLLKNDDSPATYPILHPYGHVVFQAQRGDVHTVLVNGKPIKYAHRLLDTDLPAVKREVSETVEYVLKTMGDEAWHEAMAPEIPETEYMRNPYTYTEFTGAGFAVHRDG